MLRFLVVTYLATIFTASLFAQEITDSIMVRKEYRDIERVDHIWFQSQNASGLSLSSTKDGSISFISFGRSLTDYKRVQEGTAESEFRFNAERFDNVSRYIRVYSNFEIVKSKESDRSWSDVMRTYNSNPYIFGSSILGDYDGLNFKLQSKIASTSIHRFTFGLGLDYEVGDLSRLRDPRSRTRLEEYNLIPGVTYRINDKHILGLSLRYGHRKEKLPNIITVQSDPTIVYYTLTGMEHVNGIISGYNGFKREFVNQTLGLGLDYNFRKGNLQSLFSFSYDKSKEDVWETYKGSPGYYNENIYKVSSFNTLRSSRFLHSLNVEFSLKEGKATELKQELVTTINPETGISSKHWNTLFEYKNRYQNDMLDFDINYRLYSMKSESDYNYYLGSRLRYVSVNNKYNLPLSSFDVSTVDATLEGGYRLLNKAKSKIWIEPKFSYLYSLNADLKLNDNTSEYAKQVLIPDLDYYKSSFYKTSLAIQYIFPFGLKNIRNLWYVKLQGEYLKADSSKNNKSGLISIGIYTR